ncbi:MAG: helix-turn-helix transcriptional regulator [Candidatus Acidiferrales bacterium]
MKNQILFGRRIRGIRKTARLPREKLAERAGINPNYLGEIERGEKWPSLEVLDSLSRALNVEVAAFFDYESYEPNVNLLKAKFRHLLENRTAEEIQRAHRILKALFET